MVTAAMIAMFYLGTASGVMGAVLVGTSRSRDTVAEQPLEELLLGAELPHAA
jgi:hypothetical protein